MILIVDDDLSVRSSLKLLLTRARREVMAVSSPDEALDVVRRVNISLVLADMNFSNTTSGVDGIELLRRLKVLKPEVPVILITAWASIPLAVEGIKAGAADFIAKPWDNRDLLAKITALLPSQNDDKRFDRSGIIGENAALTDMLGVAERVAPTDAAVLITGENGTGKELIAEAIHRNSLRRDRPFVKVNLGGISRTLFESELFGHRKGAFTGAVSDREGRFQIADGGTIFLDEIGELDQECQVKLLRVLQDKSFEPLGDSHTRRADVRVICATNAPLAEMVAGRKFRKDLFYRINVVTLNVPPLRDRVDDIERLARHFIAQSTRPEAILTATALRKLKSYLFPGNIRELKNMIERAAIMSPGNEIGEDCIVLPDISGNQRATLADNERQQIVDALKASSGNIAQAARMLGITRQALYRRMEKLSIG